MAALLYVKALHIVFMVSWFAGLFYMVRFFVYHTEALDADEPKRQILHEEYIKNERLLYHIITMPAMVFTVITGIIMMILVPDYLKYGWIQIKLALVLGLLVYHFYCGSIMKKLRIGQKSLSSYQFRLLNEVATLFLVAIVFIVVLKHSINWLWGTIGFIVFAIFIMSVVKFVKHVNTKKGQ